MLSLCVGPPRPDGFHPLATVYQAVSLFDEIQAVWDDGAGSEIITYRPCDNVGESACARIKAIDRPEVKPDAPKPASQSR